MGSRAATTKPAGKAKVRPDLNGAPEPAPIPNHPLAPLAGRHDGDPAWDKLMDAVREYREQMNALEDR